MMNTRAVSRLVQSAVRWRPLLSPIYQSSILQNRACSGSSNLVNVNQDAKKGVAIVELNKKPVNSLSLEMLTELNIVLEKLENDKSCRGVILTSALPTFCAGLDILEMYQPEPERLRTFWRAFQDVVLRLHGSPLINIAAISGAAPAGGCALSLACDYRIMTDGKAVIGLNESLVGIVAPYWLRKLSVYVMGTRQTDLMLQLGRMYSGKDALQLGIVDQLAPHGQVVDAALTQIDHWLAIPEAGRQLTKQVIRQPFVSDLQNKKEEDVEAFVSLITKDAIQKVLGKYMEALKQKAAK